MTCFPCKSPGRLPISLAYQKQIKTEDMKTSKNIMATIAMLMISFITFSQTTAVGHMTVTIVSPAYMASINDENLGNVSLSKASKMQANAAGIEMVKEGNVSLAAFKIASNGAAYSVTLPEEPVLTSKNNDRMKISSFKTLNNKASEISSNTDNITIGATVQVNESDAFGTYRAETPMRITVNYN